MLTALIIDDEAPSREELKALLAATPDVEVLGECANAIEGLSAIHRLRPDAVFLDIQMPRLSGLEMVSMIDAAALPQIVFVTAYDEHALQAFEEHAADYLLKPIDPQRLARTRDRLRSGVRHSPRAFPGLTEKLRQIPCFSRNRIFLLALDEVEFVHTDIAGVQVVGDKRQGNHRTEPEDPAGAYVVDALPPPVPGQPRPDHRDRIARQRRRRDHHPQR